MSYKPQNFDIKSIHSYGYWLLPNGKVIGTDSHYDVVQGDYDKAFSKKWVRILSPSQFSSLGVETAYGQKFTSNQIKIILKLAMVSEIYEKLIYIGDESFKKEKEVKAYLTSWLKKKLAKKTTKKKTPKKKLAKKTTKKKTSKKKSKK